MFSSPGLAPNDKMLMTIDNSNPNIINRYILGMNVSCRDKVKKPMRGILRCTHTDFNIIKSIGLLDNHLSGSSISHLHDVDALL